MHNDLDWIQRKEGPGDTDDRKVCNVVCMDNVLTHLCSIISCQREVLCLHTPRMKECEEEEQRNKIRHDVSAMR